MPEMRTKEQTAQKRRNDQLRPIEFVHSFTKHAAGSVLVKWGDTWVLCTASVEDKAPNGVRSH